MIEIANSAGDVVKFIYACPSWIVVKGAILHDTFSTIGGAEKLMICLAKAVGADIITGQASDEVVAVLEAQGVNIVRLGEPINEPILRTRVTIKRFSECDFQGKYDFFIFSGIHSLHAADKHKPSIWYCHHPDKGLHYPVQSTLFIKLKQAVSKRAPILRQMADAFRIIRNSKLKGLRELIRNFKALRFFKNVESDKSFVNCVTAIVVNSKYTANSVKGIFGRESVVVYPGIDTQKYSCKNPQNFWLSVNRIERHKRIMMQIKAFADLPDEHLIIVGAKGDDASFNGILDRLPENVTYKGAVSEEELAELYAGCRGFITTAIDEDFGMTVIEALASGKYVIAPQSGGYVETVLPSVGKLVPQMTAKTLAQAIKEDIPTDSALRMARAKEFDLSVFVNGMKKVIECIRAR